MDRPLNELAEIVNESCHRPVTTHTGTGATRIEVAAYLLGNHTDPDDVERFMKHVLAYPDCNALSELDVRPTDDLAPGVDENDHHG